VAKKKKYLLGDVFSIELDGAGNKGYGRILIINDDSIFIELYQVVPSTRELHIEQLSKLEVQTSLWCFDEGIITGKWKVIGNIPITNEIKMPDYWTRDIFTDEYI
jgi:hypothetical protein